MPVYQYDCQSCGRESEVFHPVIPATVPETFVGQCTECREVVTFTKKISANNFHLKGDGWEKDGYSKP